MVHASAKACYSGARGRTVHRQHDNSKGNSPQTFRASHLERHRKRITSQDADLRKISSRWYFKKYFWSELKLPTVI